MRKHLISLIFLLVSQVTFGQSTTIPTVSLQACQKDTLVMSFDITSPFNIGNLFSVEMSDNNGNFAGNIVSMSPLFAFGVSTGNQIDVLIPANINQGVYSFRLISSNPVIILDTIENVIVGANPTSDFAAYNWFDKAGTLTFCEGDTALLVANQPPAGQSYSYQWLSGGVSLVGETNDTLEVTISGTYSVEVSSNLCDAESNDTIVNSYSPSAEFFANSGAGISFIGNDSISMCEGTIATLEHFAFPSPGITKYKYKWLKADSVDIFGDTVWYYTGDTTSMVDVNNESQWFLEVESEPGGCLDTSKAFWVFVDTVPKSGVINQPWPGQALSSTTLCLTDSVLLMDTLPNNSWDYQWQIAYPSGSSNWLNLPNDTLPLLTVDTSIVADTADYRLRIVNGNCEYFTNETTINFVPFPTISILPNDSLGICAYDSVLVSLQSNALNFTWNGGTFVGNQNFISVPGQYIVEAFGINQCRTVDTFEIYNYQLVATATASPQVISPGESTTLTSSGGTSYYWYADAPSYYSNQFGESTLAIPSTDTITYFIQVEDINGCMDTANVQVFVSEQDTNVINAGIYGNLQNVITPNGDGKNDVFDLSGVTDGDDCEFTVYTRWGTPVYKMEVYNNSWGGTTDGGSQLADGTYYYVLTHDNKIRVKAAVTILNNF